MSTNYRGVIVRNGIAYGGVPIDDTVTAASENPVSSEGIYTALSAKANSADLATVATSGSYNDLTNKPILPDTSHYAFQSALAPEYDSGATYSEGDLMTYKGELYRCDPTGSSIPLDPIAQAPFTITRDGKVLTHGYTTSNSSYFVSDDIIQLGANSTYVLEIPSEQVDATTGVGDKVCFCTYTQTGTYGTRVDYYYNSARIAFTPTTSCYLSLSILKGYESGYKLYGTSTAKFVKVDVDTILVGEKTSSGGEIFNVTSTNRNTASASGTHAEGNSTTASGTAAHAEGAYGVASGDYSHAEGYLSHATGTASHAEGDSAASGMYAHAEGWQSTASGDYSHAQNYYTTAASDYQTVIGKYNVVDDQDVYALIVGNGTYGMGGNRGNALTVDWSGNVVGGTFNGMTVALDHLVINGIPLYVSTTIPTGTIPENSLGIGF